MSIRSFKRAHARRVERERRRLSNMRRRSVLVAGATLSASALMVSSAAAADYTVTTNGDGAGSCTGSAPAFSCDTLRAAVTAANSSADATNTISFDMSTVTSPITLGSPLTITADSALKIQGPGSGSLAIDGQNSTQLFTIDRTQDGTASLEIDGLTLQHGNSGSTPGGAIGAEIGNAEPLTLRNDVVTGNTTSASGGPEEGGGGVYDVGPVTVAGSTISGNTAPDGTGGGIAVREGSSGPFSKYDLTITGSTISGNSALSGGGISGSNNLVVATSHITGNSATGSQGRGTGGGIYRPEYGGSEESSTTVVASTISGNTAARAGGGMVASAKYGTSVSSSVISGNAAPTGGGVEVYGVAGYPRYFGKYNPTTITNSTISHNQSDQAGAGVDVAAAAAGNAVTIRGTTISGNQGGTNSFGGGLMLERYIISPVQVQDSTISGNTAAHGGGVSLSYYGSHAPLLYHGSSVTGRVGLTNSTVAGNTATAAAGGGGIYLGAYNTSGGPGPYKSGKATLTSTIVSGNTAAGTAQDLARGPASTSGGFNESFSLIQNPGSAPVLSASHVIHANPQLGALGNHGGLTQTMVPAGTSPVIDQGHSPASLATDQRGLARIVDIPGVPNPPGGDGTDIGAVELPANAVRMAGLTASVRGVALGGSKTPLVNGSTTPVKCSVSIGTLSSCVVQVRNSKGKVLALGEATSSRSASSLTPVVGLTAAGRNALQHSPGGVSGQATVTGETSRSQQQTVSGKVKLVGGSPITIALGSRSAKLSKAVLGQLNNLAKTLSGAKSITCTAYTNKGTKDVSVTKAQAKAACDRLVKDGFKGSVKSVGGGHSHPIAGSGSSRNRRLVISYKL